MVVIRKEQMRALEQRREEQCEEALIGFIRTWYPRQFEDLGESEVRSRIRHGIEKARRYGFTEGRQCALYVELAFLLGKDFDRDSRLPWAQSILTDEESVSTDQRIDRLYRHGKLEAAQRESER